MESKEIIFKHVKKVYGKTEVVKDLNLTIHDGERLILLGPSGCGKSTTLRMIAGLEDISSGDLYMNGIRSNDVPCGDRGVAMVFQNYALYPHMTVRQNITYGLSVHKMDKAEVESRLNEVLDMLDLTDYADRKPKELSGGQRRKIDVARALVHNPGILILDEPTTGLDPQTRKLLWDVVRNLRRTDGMTVLLTTHYMEEAADADYVVIIDSGKISAEGTPLELKNKYTGDFITLYGVSEDNINNLGLPFEKIRDAVRVSVPDTRAATQLILEHPELFSDYEITKGKMDDVFLAVTGKKPEGGENR